MYFTSKLALSMQYGGDDTMYLVMMAAAVLDGP